MKACRLLALALAVLGARAARPAGSRGQHADLRRGADGFEGAGGAAELMVGGPDEKPKEREKPLSAWEHATLIVAAIAAPLLLGSLILYVAFKRNAGDRKSLLEEYTLGDPLGEGAFGVVRACTCKATGQELAVKMVDKVETPVANVMAEAKLWEKMSHPHVVRFHELFVERFFVCLVLDRYVGGDLMAALERTTSRGSTFSEVIVHRLSRQMAAAVQFLHSRSVVHRDIKGDNFMLDRENLADIACHLALTDFGDACELAPGERLKAQVGSRRYWCPEVLQMDYSFKVDVWAMGVVMYGLLTGRFPFRDDEEAIRTQRPPIEDACASNSAGCRALITKLLAKNESGRPTADEAMAHEWFRVADRSAERAAAPEAPKGQESTSDMVWQEAERGKVNLRERRELLIERLVNADRQYRDRGVSDLDCAKPQFSVQDPNSNGGQFVYEWWEADKVRAKGILPAEQEAKKQEGRTAADLALFSEMLESHGILTLHYGVGAAKTVEQLADEVGSGTARLMLDATMHKKLVRVVHVVLLRLYTPDRETVLLETSETLADGRKRENLQLPGTIKEPHENTVLAVVRLLAQLQLGPDCVDLEFQEVERFEDEKESPSYPGLHTVYRKEIVQGVVSASADPKELSAVGLPKQEPFTAKDAAGITYFYGWVGQAEAEARQVKLRTEGSEHVSALVKAPLGLSERELQAKLAAAGVNTALFGRDGATSLKELASELVRGHCALAAGKGGKLVLMVDVVVLILCNPTGDILVNSGYISPNSNLTEERRDLPSAPRRPDESHFICAKRLVRRQLGMSENTIRFSEEVRVLEEEVQTPTYPGLRTVRRQFLLHAELSLLPRVPSASCDSG